MQQPLPPPPAGLQAISSPGAPAALDRCCVAFFGDHRPARTVLGVAAIRKGFAVQASLVAARP